MLLRRARLCVSLHHRPSQSLDEVHTTWACEWRSAHKRSRYGRRYTLLNAVLQGSARVIHLVHDQHPLPAHLLPDAARLVEPLHLFDDLRDAVACEGRWKQADQMRRLTAATWFFVFVLSSYSSSETARMGTLTSVRSMRAGMKPPPPIAMITSGLNSLTRGTRPATVA
jgi:hypothetical protein